MQWANFLKNTTYKVDKKNKKYKQPHMYLKNSF